MRSLQRFQAIETLDDEYKTTPDETLLQKIEAAIQLAITNIQPLLAPLGLPAAAAQKIAAIAQLILSQLEAWASIFPAASPAPELDAAEAIATPKATTTIGKPLSPKSLRNALNSLIEQQTGDEATDAAFATIPKLV